jgi:hypothetical protein
MDEGAEFLAATRIVDWPATGVKEALAKANSMPKTTAPEGNVVWVIRWFPAPKSSMSDVLQVDVHSILGNGETEYYGVASLWQVVPEAELDDSKNDSKNDSD